MVWTKDIGSVANMIWRKHAFGKVMHIRVAAGKSAIKSLASKYLNFLATSSLPKNVGAVKKASCTANKSHATQLKPKAALY
eukprot:scaffold237216_cov41-Prasinocladus_malaysianus.AAC.1